MVEVIKNSKTLSKLQCYGEQSEIFDDSSLINTDYKIKSITIYYNEVINAIEIEYSNSKIFKYGDNSGTSKTLNFNDNEDLIELQGIYGSWNNITVIKQLSLITNKKTEIFGNSIDNNNSNNFSIKSSKEYPIIGFYGSTISYSNNKYISEIGAIIVVPELPKFYQKARENMILSLYDNTFNKMKEKNGWTWSNNDSIANDKFKELRTKIVTQKDYYTNPYESQYFNAVIEKIRETDLFQFIQGLPKGAVLHLHPTSMGDFKLLLENTSKYNDDVCQVRFLYKDKEKNIIDNINTDPHSFQWKSNPNKNENVNPNLGEYINLIDALNNPELRQPTIDLLVLNPSVMNYEGDMWDLFQPVFSRVGTILNKTDLEENFYKDAFEYLAKKDNLTHVEIRSPWNPDNEQLKGTTENAIINASTNAGTSLRVINFNSRHIKESSSINLSVLENVVNTGKWLINNNSKYLCGYDLVSEEDTGATTQFLMNDFYIAFEQLNNYLPPFFFHDGESDLPPDYDPNDQDNPVDPNINYTNNNLIDAYLLNTLQVDNFKMTTNRVGHGLELFKTPKLFEDYKKANIVIELCPISNQLLRYVKDLREHPGQAYLASGLPVSINSDDPAIYGYQGISFDFWEAVIGWGLDLKMVKVLCYYSLAHSSLSENEKINKLENWNTNWNNYINEFLK